MKTALILIDFQRDYFPGGKQPMVAALEAAKNAYLLLQCFREHGGYHVHVQHIAQEPGATLLVSGDRGTDIHDAVAHFEGEPIVYKHTPNAFLGTELLTLLKNQGIVRLVLCGMATHLAVEATARAASDLGFQVIVAEDACATRDLTYAGTTIPAEQVHKVSMAILEAYGRVMKSEVILATLAAELAPR